MIDQAFVTAGKAIFTVSNAQGEHYTYKVTHKEANGNNREAWFASVLTGPDNTADYTYLGMVDPADGNVRLTKSSRYTDDSQPVRVVRWALRLVWNQKNPPEGYAVQHNGRCGRCGRLLTVPESIDTGIGPECAKRIG